MAEQKVSEMNHNELKQWLQQHYRAPNVDDMLRVIDQQGDGFTGEEFCELEERHLTQMGFAMAFIPALLKKMKSAATDQQDAEMIVRMARAFDEARQDMLQNSIERVNTDLAVQILRVSCALRAEVGTDEGGELVYASSRKVNDNAQRVLSQSFPCVCVMTRITDERRIDRTQTIGIQCDFYLTRDMQVSNFSVYTIGHTLEKHLKWFRIAQSDRLFVLPSSRVVDRYLAADRIQTDDFPFMFVGALQSVIDIIISFVDPFFILGLFGNQECLVDPFLNAWLLEESVKRLSWSAFMTRCKVDARWGEESYDSEDVVSHLCKVKVPKRMGCITEFVGALAETGTHFVVGLHGFGDGMFKLDVIFQGQADGVLNAYDKMTNDMQLDCLVAPLSWCPVVGGIRRLKLNQRDLKEIACSIDETVAMNEDRAAVVMGAYYVGVDEDLFPEFPRFVRWPVLVGDVFKTWSACASSVTSFDE